MMASIVEIIQYYQRSINNNLQNEVILLQNITELNKLPMKTADIKETGVNKTIHPLKNLNGNVGVAAKYLLEKWKSMLFIVDKIEYYRNYIYKVYLTPEKESEVLHCLQELNKLPIGVTHLEETSISRTVGCLQIDGGKIGAAAKRLVNKWNYLSTTEITDTNTASPIYDKGGYSNREKQKSLPSSNSTKSRSVKAEIEKAKINLIYSENNAIKHTHQHHNKENEKAYQKQYRNCKPNCGASVNISFSLPKREDYTNSSKFKHRDKSSHSSLRKENELPYKRNSSLNDKVHIKNENLLFNLISSKHKHLHQPSRNEADSNPRKRRRRNSDELKQPHAKVSKLIAVEETGSDDCYNSLMGASYSKV